MPHANLEVLVDEVRKKQFVHGFEESHEFFSACEQVADLASIEQPLSQDLFDDLINLF